MPVNKFGRTDTTNTTRVVSGGITLNQANDVFLRRDGGNAAAADINLNSQKLINIADPTNNKDAAHKEYVDKSGADKLMKSGDTMTGNLMLSLNTSTNDHIRTLGCSDLGENKTFHLYLGDESNKIKYQKGLPILIQTSDGLLCKKKRTRCNKIW